MFHFNEFYVRRWSRWYELETIQARSVIWYHFELEFHRFSKHMKLEREFHHTLYFQQNYPTKHALATPFQISLGKQYNHNRLLNFDNNLSKDQKLITILKHNRFPIPTSHLLPHHLCHRLSIFISRWTFFVNYSPLYNLPYRNSKRCFELGQC